MNIQKEFCGDPQYVNITNGIVVEDLGFAPNDCLRNSYLLASTYKNVKMAEGLLITLCDEKVISIVPHCWNNFDNQYVDVTNDFIWQSESFKQKLRNENGQGKYTYKYLLCTEYPLAESFHDPEEDKFAFHFTYKDLIDYFKNNLA